MTSFKIAIVALALAASGATAALADDVGGNNTQPLYGAGMTNTYSAPVVQRRDSYNTQSAGTRAYGLSSSDALVLHQLESGEASEGSN